MKFPALPPAATLNGTEVVPVTQSTADARTTSQAIADLVRGTKGADIASAATTPIGAATGLFVHVTGTTTITAFDTAAAGVLRFVEFAGALLLTYNATTLILPAAANITTAAGDCAIFVSEGSGNWRCLDYTRANGAPFTSSANTWASTQTFTVAPVFTDAPGARNALGVAQALSRTAVKTANYTAVAGDLVPCDSTSGGFIVTLPTAPADHTPIAVKHITQGGANVITIACGGADVFNAAGGATTKTLPLLSQAVLLTYQASTAIWTVLADDLSLASLDGRYPAGSGTSTGTNTGDQTSVSGNAGTATKLATARNLNGVAFDGTADITVPGSGALTGYNPQTGTSYTFAATDAGGLVRCTNASAIAFNIDTNAHVAIPANAWGLVQQGGAGIVTITALTGVTLRSPNGAATITQYDARGFSRIGSTDEWLVW